MNTTTLPAHLVDEHNAITRLFMMLIGSQAQDDGVRFSTDEPGNQPRKSLDEESLFSLAGLCNAIYEMEKYYENLEASDMLTWQLVELQTQTLSKIGRSIRHFIRTIADDNDMLAGQLKRAYNQWEICNQRFDEMRQIMLNLQKQPKLYIRQPPLPERIRYFRLELYEFAALLRVFFPKYTVSTK